MSSHVSSQNLNRMNIEISTSEKARPSLCRHTGKTCTQNCTRGFIKTFVVAFAVKYLIGILPTLLTGNIFKKLDNIKNGFHFFFLLIHALFLIQTWNFETNGRKVKKQKYVYNCIFSICNCIKTHQ